MPELTISRVWFAHGWALIPDDPRPAGVCPPTATGGGEAMTQSTPAAKPIDALAKAAATYDVAAAASATDEIVAQIREDSRSIAGPEINTAMGLLRRMRAFDLMCRLADAAITSGQDSPAVVRQYAQALIETGRLAAAESVLLHLLERPDVAEQKAEAAGLLGRINKQRYVDLGNPQAFGARAALDKSIAAYLDVYEEDGDKIWHGINAVAMLARGRRDGVDLDGPDHIEIAHEILSHIASRWLDGAAGGWDAATAMEAAVAVGDLDQARLWVGRYTASPTADAFALAASIRQLRQVWSVGDDSDMADIVQVLQAHTVGRGDGASVEVTGIGNAEGLERRSGGLEKTFGQAGAVTVRWWLQAQDRLKGIARIEDVSGEPVGTGFLVAGHDIAEAWSGEILMLTNSHVIGREFANALLPEEGWVNFTQLGTDERYQVAELLFESNPNDLDCAVLRLAAVPDGAEPLPLATRLPDAGGAQRLYVMGHPKGGELKISIDDNVLIDHDEVKVHYRAPTEPGSSGSPVFDRTWQLIALHHSGHDFMERLNGEKGTYQANEGLSLGAIRTRLMESADPD